MTVLSAAARKAWETRKKMQIARGYGPDGDKRGTETHKVKSVSDILARLRGAPAHQTGDVPTLPCRGDEAGGNGPRNAVAARTLISEPSG